ncbi:TonB-dependent receptor-like protein [Sphingobium sp. SYK-6]|uniref:TonB-dependent receptor plug domain-containing protein n=1 Tax=Sphingobium sp. (strain NBRC 103272 / SYK-6) TaxID=627192 RepID=UPI0002276F0F|nr:TonB-dependent receptor [Sphingobium sp. SYK-6]BAK67314.1 TonB-dependent receptor-like protein [Sphingobium sp. SYK-6]
MAVQSQRFFRHYLLSSAALFSTVLVCVMPSAAFAQEATDPAVGGSTNSAAAGASIEGGNNDIVVTGSRVISDGFSAPSPVTVVAAQQLLTSTPSTIGEALNKLPQFANSVRPTTSQFAPESGAATQLNLRSLGAQRSLILLDGRRVTPSTSDGIVDVSILPEELVQRVDIVTGGASAAYGSDAVAGVVNFVLDTRFKGIKAAAQAGITQRGDNETQKISLTVGANVGERLHIVASGSYFMQSGVRDYRDRDWFQSCAPLVLAGQTPLRVRTCNLKTPLEADGGLIVSGPLRGIQFGPGGVPQPFTFGNPLTPSQMVGGSGEDQGLDFTPVAAIERKTAYAHALYEASDSIDLYADALYGNSLAKFGGTLMGFYGNTALTIYRDNAFLPPSVAAQMDAAGITQFTLGHTMRQTGLLRNLGESETVRFSGGFKAKVGGDWSLDGHYGYGTNLQTIRAEGNLTIERVFDAVDAVRDPVTGNIVCNRSLTVPAVQGCVPFNVFGPDAASQAAIDYIRSSPYGGTGSRTFERTKQHVAEIVLSGTPFATWAGDVAIAVGGGYRKESVNRTVDPGSDGLKFPNGQPRGVANTRYATSTFGAYFLSNQRPIVGGYDLWEVFGEALIPLADGVPFAQKLDLNLAGRHTSYSTSGGVNTWKVGLNWQPIDDIRFRATRSRDIRAPNLRELFSTSAAGASAAVDPFRNNETPVVVSQANGSTALKPEVADTLTVGGVFTPSFIPGLNISADYYTVQIDDAIGQLGVQNIIDQCFRGATALCPRLERAPNGVLFRVDNGFLNINRLKTRGLDIEGSYRTELGSGSLGLRAIASRVFELSTLIPGSTVVNRAGQVGVDGGVPKWTFNINATLKFGGFTASVDERIIGAGTYDATFVEGVTIDDNHVPAITYTDLSLTQDITTENGRKFQIFATVNNLLDQDPPGNAGNFFVFATRPTNTFLYDQIGRSFTVGVRVQL